MQFNSEGIGKDSLTYQNVKNLSLKENSIRNLDLNRIGKENSESAAISVARIDANAEKKNYCKKSSLQEEGWNSSGRRSCIS
ncbi:hypothetical protein wHmb_05950 [Wolbachia pipientis]|uniref:hypothetical protein n=1 Tax=Wolbachia pipientis TaxID=955 RepID=UPI0024774FCF|nr:hypothetical protein [Wolbachia pipientis]GKS79709.1 hypothetical protein wHmb_05950 [Wolbachia pipientis]